MRTKVQKALRFPLKEIRVCALCLSLMLAGSSPAHSFQAGGVEIGDFETGSVVGQPFNELPAGSLSKYTITLESVEVTQAIQALNLQNPLDSATNNTVTLIAGKRTIVRAYFDLKIEELGSLGILLVPSISGELTGTKNGVELPFRPSAWARPFVVRLGPGPTLNEKRAHLSQSLNFELPSDWVVEGPLGLAIQNVRLMPADSWQCSNCNTKVPVQFHASAPLKLKLIKWIETNPSTTPPAGVEFDEHIEYIKSWLKRAFPIAPADLHVEVEDLPRDMPDGIINDCEDAAIETAVIRATQDNAPNFDHRTRYVGLFVNRPTGGLDQDGTPSYMSGCTYVHLGPDNIGVSNPANSVAVPLGSPASWARMNWDLDNSYADWYAGHELGHTFGLGHLPFGVFCEDPAQPNWPTVPPCPPDPYDGYWPLGKISPPTAEFFGFDMGDTVNGADLDPEPLDGFQWHDMMTYSRYIWVSANHGVDGIGASGAGRSYKWIWNKLLAESNADTTPPGAPTGLDITESTRSLYGDGGRAFLAHAGVRPPVVLVDTDASQQHPPKSRTIPEPPIRGKSFLRVVAVVDLKNNTWKFRLVRLVEHAPVLPKRREQEISSFIRLIDKKKEEIIKPFPVLVMGSPDALPGQGRKVLVDAAIPLPVGTDLTQLDRLELVVKSPVVKDKAVTVKETVATLQVSATAPVVKNIEPSIVLKPVIALSWKADDEDTDQRALTYTVQISADRGKTWRTLAVGYQKTTLTLDAAQVRSLGIEEGTEVLVKVIANDGFNSGPEKIERVLVKPTR